VKAKDPKAKNLNSKPKRLLKSSVTRTNVNVTIDTTSKPIEKQRRADKKKYNQLKGQNITLSAKYSKSAI